MIYFEKRIPNAKLMEILASLEVSGCERSTISKLGREVISLRQEELRLRKALEAVITAEPHCDSDNHYNDHHCAYCEAQRGLDPEWKRG